MRRLPAAPGLPAAIHFRIRHQLGFLIKERVRRKARSIPVPNTVIARPPTAVAP
jgi:hypothetical protein